MSNPSLFPYQVTDISFIKYSHHFQPSSPELMSGLHHVCPGDLHRTLCKINLLGAPEDKFFSPTNITGEQILLKSMEA